jgi:2-polyprenyl-3-methyl-5-hydroxy-6-metoxy-1,4-benzoquinol methylase
MSEYKDFGFNHAGASHAHQYLDEPILSLLDLKKNKKIIDLGCGNGALVKLLVEKGFDAYGTDASKKGIAIASQTMPERFAVQDLSKDQLPENLVDINFDTVISTEVVEHLYDPRKFAEFCKNILSQNGGGELIISTPYHGYFKNLIITLLDKWDAHTNPLFDGGHIKFWSKATLSKLLEEQGFTITHFIGCGRIPYLWKSMIIKAKI